MGEEMHLCHMLLDGCCQERNYNPFYANFGVTLCRTTEIYVTKFGACFVQQYSTIHQRQTYELRNVAKFFAHMFAADVLPWSVLSNNVRLSEEDTNSSSRVFLKILFQELAELLGIPLLNQLLMQESFDQSIFLKDTLKNTRFCINFLTSIGLGELTTNLREYYTKQTGTASGHDDSGSSSDDDSDSSCYLSSDEN